MCDIVWRKRFKCYSLGFAEDKAAPGADSCSSLFWQTSLQAHPCSSRGRSFTRAGLENRGLEGIDIHFE